MLKLGGEKQICFGADFFHDEDLPLAFRKPPDVVFFPEYSDASSYPKLLDLWKMHLGINDEVLENIAYKNLKNFLNFTCMISV
jgi:microsomal dipeptidase-like Zn-dependent dipeptidase